jgi:methylase of polypeptide subunit release factors
MGIETKEYFNGLTKLDMLGDELYSLGLIQVKDLKGDNSKMNFHQRFHLEKAKRVNADAVYFRNYPNNSRPSIPQLYIFDFTKNERDIVEIHKNVWSTSEVRLYVVITKSEVKLFNASKPVEYSEKSGFKVSPFDVLNLVSDALEKFERYSGKKFDNGTFWEETQVDFGYSTTSYEKLISELKYARITFLEDINLEKQVANKLLVLGILIKYLEERIDIDNNGNETKVFSTDFFNKSEFGYSKSFIDVVRKGHLIDLFDYLSEHFNGKIFYLPAEYKDQLKGVNLSPLANFLSGDVNNKQYVLWRLYSFNHLPIELISSVYEMFLEADKNKGIAYTPSYLVNFMIDECMPMHSPKSNFKILDPACGSGIFLVSAYKRMIDWWRIEKYKKTGKWIKPEKEHLDELKNLLKDSIYGVDIEKEAVDLAIFSLSLTMCDMLSPKVIWENLRFDDLSNNIVESDFFKWFSEDKIESFDLVIGNPPFVEYGSKEVGINNLSKDIEVEVPQNQSSLWFTLQGIKLVKKESGLLAFIVPSGPLLYNNSKKPIDFRKWLFSHYNIPQIIDFTYLSNVLFKNKGNEKNVAVSSIFIENKQPDNEPISHVTVKKLKSAKERQYFEIDHYDFHKVNKASALNDAFVWKANLLGGGRLPSLIKRLSSFQTLEEFLNSRKKRGWVYGEGFNTSRTESQVTKLDVESGRFKKADYITNHETLPTEAFGNDGVDENKIFLLKDVYFYNRVFRSKEIFAPPHILIKESIGKISVPVAFFDKYLTFRNEIVGIHAPEKDKTELLCIKDRFSNNQLYRFYLLNVSARAGVTKSTFPIYKQDIMSLPYPENESDIELSEYEQILVDDTLNYGLDFLGKETGVKSLESASEPEIKEFGSIFSKVLNSLFEEGNKKYQLENIYKTETLIGVSLYYSANISSGPTIYVGEASEVSLARLIQNKISTNYRINRIVKFYDGDRIYFLKPKELRYWLKSVALRDADETIVDLYNAGY